MALQVPDGYTDIPTVWKAKGQISRFIGVVVDYLTPTRTRGTDWAMTFTLVDTKWKADFEVKGEGLKCRFFKPDVKRLPRIESKGDVVVLRNMKITEFNGVPCAISTSSSVWQVFAENDIPDTPGPKVSPRALAGTQPLPEAVVGYAIALCNDQDRSFLRSSNLDRANTPGPIAVDQNKSSIESSSIQALQSRDKFRLVENLSLPNPGDPLFFADLMGEVRKIFLDDYRVELSVTDYTHNRHLFNYDHNDHNDRAEGKDGDEFGYTLSKAQESWPGPWGRMTMVVTLWDANAQFARTSLRMGQYVFLRNVHIKQDRTGVKLEGALRANIHHPDQVRVSIIQPARADQDYRFKELLKRRKEYESKSRKEGRILLKDGISKERRHDQHDTGTKSESKNSRQKRNRKNKKRKMEENQPSTDEVKVAKFETNMHVARKNINIPCTSLNDILEPSNLSAKSPKGNSYRLPFRNVSYLTKVRVLDFLPDRLEDFAAPHANSEYDVLSSTSEDSASEMDVDGSDDVKWEWRFALLVEDAGSRPCTGQPKERMVLQVFGTDGDYLLNMEAEDLGKNLQALAKVREKLFVVWGDLEERKREGPSIEVPSTEALRPSAKPFECLIKEYGSQKSHMRKASPLERWDRCFRLYGTTIRL